MRALFRGDVVECNRNPCGLERADACAGGFPHAAFGVQVTGHVDAERRGSNGLRHAPRRAPRPYHRAYGRRPESTDPEAHTHAAICLERAPFETAADGFRLGEDCTSVRPDLSLPLPQTLELCLQAGALSVIHCA
jgi:hypothetical protein